MFKFVMICCLTLASCTFADIYKERFERIYEEKLWGENEIGEGFSGGGSLIENIHPYYDYLTDFLYSKNIKSVVDLGCGDWQFSRYIDWKEIDYKGFDVVSAIIERDKFQYEAENIHFYCANFLETEIPSADLLICKHVLQHMPNSDVLLFIKLIPKFKHCLIVEDMTNYKGYNIDHPKVKEFPFWSDSGTDLSEPPFNLKGSKTYFYEANGNKHLIFHIENDQ